MPLDIEQFKIEPTAEWPSFRDGYETAEIVHRSRWKPVAGWGRDGYDLGSWPYVIVFFKKHEEGETFDLAIRVEGDIVQYACPDESTRHAVCDEIAFWHWRFNEEEWVKDYTTTDELPDELKGPYRHE